MPFPPMPGPPETPVIPWPIFVRVKDTQSGAYASGASIIGANETDGGYSVAPNEGYAVYCNTTGEYTP